MIVTMNVTMTFGHFFRETAQSVLRVFGHVDKSKGLSLYSSLPMPELWAKKYPGFSHYLIKSRSRVRSRTAAVAKNATKNVPASWVMISPLYVIASVRLLTFYYGGSQLPRIDLYLIFEKSSLKNQNGQTWFFVYLELDFCRLHRQ